MTKFTLIALALPILAQTTPDLSGVWELNKAKASSTRLPDSLQCRIDQQGSSIVITTRVQARGETLQQLQKYVAGGETNNNVNGMSLASRAEWDNGALLVRETGTMMGKELRLTGRWSLSTDGATLTLRQRRQFGTEPEAEDVIVLDRRPATAWQPDAPPKPAEEVFKNIQILKGVPSTRLRPVMLNLTRWLGVECAHCHVMNEFEKDDKPAKQTARKMFRMVRSLNQDNFPGANSVTCWTCHRGQAKPEGLPK